MGYPTLVFQFFLYQKDNAEPTFGRLRVVEVNAADSYVKVLVYIGIIDVVG
mgnify:CR=1 FL=1